MNLRERVGSAALAIALGIPAAESAAATLSVGPGGAYPTLAAAAGAAAAGDTISLGPGTYRDCATLRADRVTIRGEASGATLDGVACDGKAALVIKGSDVVVDGLTFSHIAVPDHNGAGIRMEGHNLTVLHSRFIENEEGILTGDDPLGALVVRDSEFTGNGTCEAACAHGIYAGHLRALTISGSHFYANRVGHHIKSRAAATTIVNSTIEDGPVGTASYLVDLPNGGNLLISGSRLEKGPNSSNPAVAISIGEEGDLLPADALVIEESRFVNDLPAATIFVRNATPTPVSIHETGIAGRVTRVSGAGS